MSASGGSVTSCFALDEGAQLHQVARRGVEQSARRRMHLRDGGVHLLGRGVGIDLLRGRDELRARLLERALADGQVLVERHVERVLVAQARAVRVGADRKRAARRDGLDPRRVARHRSHRARVGAREIGLQRGVVNGRERERHRGLEESHRTGRVGGGDALRDRVHRDDVLLGLLQQLGNLPLAPNCELHPRGQRRVVLAHHREDRSARGAGVVVGAVAPGRERLGEQQAVADAVFEQNLVELDAQRQPRRIDAVEPSEIILVRGDLAFYGVGREVTEHPVVVVHAHVGRVDRAGAKELLIVGLREGLEGAVGVAVQVLRRRRGGQQRRGQHERDQADGGLHHTYNFLNPATAPPLERCGPRRQRSDKEPRNSANREPCPSRRLQRSMLSRSIGPLRATAIAAASALRSVK